MKNLIFLFLLLTTAASAQDTIRYCTGQFSEAYIEALQEQGNVMLDTCKPKIIGTLLKARDLQPSYKIYFKQLKKQHPESDENTHGLFNYSENYLMLDFSGDSLNAHIYRPMNEVADLFIDYLLEQWPQRFDGYKTTIDSLNREIDYLKYVGKTLDAERSEYLLQQLRKGSYEPQDPKIEFEELHPFGVYWLKADRKITDAALNAVTNTRGVSRAYIVYAGNEEIMEQRIQIELLPNYLKGWVLRDIETNVKNALK